LAREVGTRVEEVGENRIDPRIDVGPAREERRGKGGGVIGTSGRLGGWEKDSPAGDGMKSVKKGKRREKRGDNKRGLQECVNYKSARGKEGEGGKGW